MLTRRAALNMMRTYLFFALVFSGVFLFGRLNSELLEDDENSEETSPGNNNGDNDSGIINNNKQLSFFQEEVIGMIEDVLEDKLRPISNLKIELNQVAKLVSGLRNTVARIQATQAAGLGRTYASLSNLEAGIRNLDSRLNSTTSRKTVTKNGNSNEKSNCNKNSNSNSNKPEVTEEEITNEINVFSNSYVRKNQRKNQRPSSVVTSNNWNLERSYCSKEIGKEVSTLMKRYAGQCRRLPTSCADWHRFGARKSGTYVIYPRLSGYDVFAEVFCDQDTQNGGWTLIQRRGDFGEPRLSFQKNWTDYKSGFGDANKEFWIGNDMLYALSNQEPVELLIQLESFDNETRWVKYEHFRIDDEKGLYRLNIKGQFTGDTGDSMRRSTNAAFSTADSDNDSWSGHCAEQFKGGWWFSNCHDSNLNGIYYPGPHESYGDGINWYHWRGFHYSLRTTRMLIRPRNYHVT